MKQHSRVIPVVLAFILSACGGGGGGGGTPPTGGGATSTPAATATPSATPSSASITIDANAASLGTVNRDLFGANFTASMNLTNTNGYFSTMMSTFQNAHFGLARWPLALLSDYYHWQSNTFSSCAAAYNPAARTTFDQFMQQVAQPLGWDVDITVNYGSNATCTGGGDPNEAAAWVDYANNTMHYGIKYWTVGNEQYFGSPVLGTSLTTPDFNVSQSDPPSAGSATYASLVATQFYPLMKAKDPTIQIGVDLAVPENAASSRTAPWDSTVLSQAKYDFVEVHWYPNIPPNADVPDSTLIAQSVSYTESALATLKSELATAGKPNTPIYVGEWGIPGTGPQNTSITGALSSAIMLGEFLKGGVAMSSVWMAFDSGPCSAVPSGHYTQQAWQTPSLFEAIAGGVNPACPSDAQPPVGTPFPRANAMQVVQQAFTASDTIFSPAVTGLPTVLAYGARRSSGYGVLLINTDENNTVTTDLKIANDTRSFSAKSTVYDKALYDASSANVWSAPATQSLGTVQNTMSVTLPPWSITALTLSAP